MDAKKFFGERYAQTLLGNPEAIRKIDPISQGILGKVYDALDHETIHVGTVIDYGCGVGKMVPFLLQAFKPKKYIGMDIVPAVIKSNKAFYRDLEGVEFKSATGLAKSKADVIFTASTLQHIDDEAVEKTIADFAKVLNPGGRLIVWVNTAVAKGDLPYMKRRDKNVYIQMIKDAGFTNGNGITIPIDDEEITVFISRKKEKAKGGKGKK